MKISEIFYSISGEGIHAGTPTVLVRLQGCNLRCDYCDTEYALDPLGGEELSMMQIVSRLQLNPTAPVLITGGEPLLQSEVGGLAAAICGRRIEVEIETNGSLDPPLWFELVDSWNVDVKCPSSGPAYGTFRTEWLRKLRKQDQLKFVVGTQEDLGFVRGFLNDTRIKPIVLVSPIAEVGNPLGNWNREWLQEVAEFCKERNVRMSLQLHKVIWGSRRGV